MHRLTTRIELTPFGYVGCICRDLGDGLTIGRYVIPYGSRRTVRRALRRELSRHRQG
jgi:hypothetical protein